MSQDTVREIEQGIRAKKEIVELHSAVERLAKNIDFKKVVTEGYLRDEAVRLVHLKGDPAMQTPDKQARVVAEIDGISRLAEYFRAIRIKANIAASGIEADEQTLVELAGEELGE